jgi:hypothetical protein
MNTFTKTLRDGRTATVTPIAGTGFVRAAIGGKEVYSGTLAVAPKLPNIPAEMTRRAGPVLLTEAEYDQIRAIQAAAWQAWLATPEGRAADLKAQRESLLRALNAAGDAWTSGRADAQDNDSMDAYYAGQDAQDQAAITAAERALADFDAAHPEIAAEIRRQREADVARWMDL